MTVKEFKIANKIKIPSWYGGRDKFREVVRIKDKHTCQKCGQKWEGGRRFDVHHIDCLKEKTRQLDINEDINNLITLCRRCHLNLPEHREAMKFAYRLKRVAC